MKIADVVEVIAWADAQRGRRTYVLYVCVPHCDLGLVRLAGADPDDHPPPTKLFASEG